MSFITGMSPDSFWDVINCTSTHCLAVEKEKIRITTKFSLAWEKQVAYSRWQLVMEREWKKCSVTTYHQMYLVSIRLLKVDCFHDV